MCRIVFVILAMVLGHGIGHAQIAVSPSDPALTGAICDAGLPPVSHDVWDGELPEWSAGTGRALYEVTLSAHPDAICNDGSPAKIYVRPAPETLPNGQVNPLRKSFHIHLKGGGSCRSFAECQQRFCRAAGASTNTPGLMSSVGWPRALRGTGLFADYSQNRFSHMNQVLVGYCSSDTWIGSALPGSPVSNYAMDDPNAVSQIAFMGEAIVNAALETMYSGLTVPTPISGQPDYIFPALTDASHLILSGDSAGANGVRHHLDRIADMFPTTATLGLLDAGEVIDMTDARIDWSNHPSWPAFDAFMDHRVRQARSFHGVADSALNKGCKDDNPGDGFDEQACFNGFELSRSYIKTPHLQRFSLSDVTTVRGIGALVSGPLPPTIRELTAESAAQIATANSQYSALGANCRRHVTFRNTQQVRFMHVLSGGPALYRELANWVSTCISTGTCTQVTNVAIPTVPGSSICP